MNDEELKKLWQQQPLRTPDVSPTQLVSAMQQQTTQLRRTLDARDLRELAACAVVIIIFGIFYFTVYRTPISRLGDLIVIGGAIFIAWKIIYTRWTTPPAPPGATVVESLRAELKAVRAQSRLLGSVLWWYILPGFIGVTVATWGLPTDIYSKIFTTLVFIAVNAFVWWLNQWARTKQLLPLEAQLETLIHSAETGEAPAETRISNLRPIVLSMAAADHVKPVEFKVALSQLAIYGVPAFVGIWFFTMFAFTAGDAGLKTEMQTRPAVSPIFIFQETNRYSVVTHDLVGLLNAHDYSAVQKQLTPEMSRFLPPEKASMFFTDLTTRYGNIERVDGPATNGYHGWTAFRLDCQRGELTLSLALDADDKIDGFYFKPANRLPVNFKSFVRLLFSWQHLIWLVPFVMAGFVYSWLIQKTTKRAVGISALGIHLHKGHSLILWDEIKEARTLRILNIRSLWLIRESGEKTILPWTSLERPADLKVAVENYAPADHPIRKHLPLLRQK